MQLAAGQGGLQDVARVHGALGGTGPDDGVQLVDEQDDPAVGLLDLLEHGLQTILELAAVLGACYEGAHVELDDVLVLDRRGDVTGYDALGEPLDDGGLAHARLADEHGVVLGATREHLDGAANLLDTADDGIELTLAGEVGHVATVLLQRVELGLRVLRGHALVSAQVVKCLLDSLACDTRTLEGRASVPLLVGECAEQMLARDVGISHLARELLGSIAHAGKLVRDAHLRHVARHVRSTCYSVVYLCLDLRGICAHALDDGAEIALPRREQGLEQVYGLHLTSLGVGRDTP